MASVRAGRKKARNSGKGPRYLAVRALSAWLSTPRENRQELEKLGDFVLKGGRLEERDRALFWQLLVGSVRWLRLLRWHLERYVKKFSKLPPHVQAILITGAYQIIFLSRIPYFSAVDESVKLTRAFGASWASALVNASLRRLAGASKTVIQDEKELLERCKGREANCISNLTSHPHWMVKRWLKRWGAASCAGICIKNNIQPELTIRVNTLKTGRHALLSLLKDHGVDAVETSVSPYGLRILGFRGRVERLPGFKKGLFQVQDEAAQIVSMLLKPEKGQRVLDACAGVGGKTTHIAELMQNKGQIIACDTNMHRLDLLQENAKRLGAACIRIKSLREAEMEIRGGGTYFERILVDAPCSGLGVIRRHPDIKWNRTPGDVFRLAEKQLSLLKTWISSLKKGGILVYSVCTLELEETLGVAERFLKDHPFMRQVPVTELLPGLPTDLVEEGFFRAFPGQYEMDGFFCAVFRRSDA